MNLKVGWGWVGSLFVAIFFAISARAETFIFIAQPDPPPNGPINFDWFSANNWFTNDPVSMSLKHANTLPAPGDIAQIDGGVNAAANTIHLDTLILTANAAVSGGDFICSKVQMHGGSGGGNTSFTSSTVEVLTEMDVFGGSCAFNSSALNIDFGATCFVGLAGTGQLTFGSSQLFNDGEISLYPNSASEITGGTNFVNASGAMIVGTSNTYFTVSGNFDNSGIVESDSGTLQVSASTWSSTSGLGIFRTTASNAVISIASTLTIPPNTTNIFEGPGPIQLQNGASIQGIAQVGVLSGFSVLGPLQTRGAMLDNGILQFANQLGGTGLVEVVALPGSPSVLLANSNVSGSITGLVVNIDAGGQFNVAYNLNSLSLALNSGVIITNYGTTTWAGHGSISMTGNAVFNNMASGVFDSQIQNSVVDGTLGNGGLPGGGAFNNYGTFRKSAGTNVLQLAPDFNNSGVLDLEIGQVQVYGGTSPGIFSAAPGTEIRLGAASGVRTNYLMSGVQFMGTNFVRANQNSTLMIDGDITMENLSFENGTLDGPGKLTVSNVFNWSGGNMQGNGIIDIPVGANCNVTAASTLVQRTINNFGTMTMSNTSSGFYIGVNTNVVLNNMPGALLQIRNNGGFGFPNPLPVPRPVLNNFGAIEAISSTAQSPLAFNITNSGTVLVRSNQLNCYVYDQAAGLTTVASNATLNPSGFVLQGGVVNGAGTIQGSSASGFLISGGVVNPGNPIGILNLPNGSYTQAVSGTLSITIGGTNAGAQYSRLALGGGVLGGTLNVSFTNGFQPSMGDVYYVVSGSAFGAVTGTFSHLKGLTAANGIVLVPQYQNFGVNLVAATNPVISSLAHSGNQFSFSFPTTTNVTNVVEYSDSLNPPVWKPFSTNTGDGNVKVIVDPSATVTNRFYRVLLR